MTGRTAVIAAVVASAIGAIVALLAGIYEIAVVLAVGGVAIAIAHFEGLRLQRLGPRVHLVRTRDSMLIVAAVFLALAVLGGVDVLETTVSGVVLAAATSGLAASLAWRVHRAVSEPTRETTPSREREAQ